MNDSRPVTLAFDKAEIGCRLASGRHVVILSVPWSVYAVKAVKAAATQSEFFRSFDASLTFLEEDDIAVRQWLIDNGIPASLNYSSGSGSSVWISDGRVDHYHIGMLDTDGLQRTAHDIWNRAST